MCSPFSKSTQTAEKSELTVWQGAVHCVDLLRAAWLGSLTALNPHINTAKCVAPLARFTAENTEAQ